ncbi:MAG TPA: hypothetical protein DCW68_02660 [Rhodospirillaceae bacterium]|nr:MAG: hypothetical protein A2018_05635 [Alphaproteobacteria bacterium GWF2_58_20]HAU28996.1 hypothetical protein [Rhodospirillaceae bacterium]
MMWETARNIASLLSDISVICGVILIYLARKQLKASAEAINISRWDSLLSFEQDMFSRQANFISISQKIRDAKLENKGETELIKAEHEAAKEIYLNSVDRLATCILRGHFSDPEMRPDYSDFINNVVNQFKDDLGVATHYRNIVKLYDKWKDKV